MFGIQANIQANLLKKTVQEVPQASSAARLRPADQWHLFHSLHGDTSATGPPEQSGHAASAYLPHQLVGWAKLTKAPCSADYGDNKTAVKRTVEQWLASSCKARHDYLSMITLITDG